METNKKIIVIAAGGTGGHIFPGLAVAEKLIANGHKVEWIGTHVGLEAILVPKNNININYITITGVRGKNWITKLLAPVNILLAIIQSIKILYQLNPNTVLGMGGFVSGPVGIAAWLLGKRLVIHEQNAVAGSSNRILANFANHILESFPNSFPTTPRYKNKIILTGLPVRKNLLGTSSSTNVTNNTQDLSKKSGINILVLGGSRGAQFLNKTIPLALAKITNIKVLHQTGERELLVTSELYKSSFKDQLSNSYEVKPFIDNMLEAYLGADLIICRAGASTIFEIMAIGIASILIPLPWAIDDHQTKNALYLVNNSAGILLKQSEATVEKLQTLISELIADRSKLELLKSSSRSLYKQYELKDSTNYISTIASN